VSDFSTPKTPKFHSPCSLPAFSDGSLVLGGFLINALISWEGDPLCGARNRRSGLGEYPLPYPLLRAHPTPRAPLCDLIEVSIHPRFCPPIPMCFGFCWFHRRTDQWAGGIPVWWHTRVVRRSGQGEPSHPLLYPRHIQTPRSPCVLHSIGFLSHFWEDFWRFGRISPPVQGECVDSRTYLDFPQR
jgi:hypothetical protein